MHTPIRTAIKTTSTTVILRITMSTTITITTTAIKITPQIRFLKAEGRIKTLETRHHSVLRAIMEHTQEMLTHKRALQIQELLVMPETNIPHNTTRERQPLTEQLPHLEMKVILLLTTPIQEQEDQVQHWILEQLRLEASKWKLQIAPTLSIDQVLHLVEEAQQQEHKQHQQDNDADKFYETFLTCTLFSNHTS